MEWIWMLLTNNFLSFLESLAFVPVIILVGKTFVEYSHKLGSHFIVHFP